MSSLNIELNIGEEALLKFVDSGEPLMGSIIISVDDIRITGKDPKREYVLAMCKDLLRAIPPVLKSTSQTVYFKESPPYELYLEPNGPDLSINCIYTPSGEPVNDDVPQEGMSIPVEDFVNEVIKTGINLSDRLGEVHERDQSSDSQELQLLIENAIHAKNSG